MRFIESYPSSARIGAMVDKRPLTIEILALGPEGPIVRDRVIGGTFIVEEAKRIGGALAFPDRNFCWTWWVSNFEL
jgi:hypothetical protein